MNKLLLTGLFLTITAMAFCQQRVFPITAYGAKADGKADNTQAIQKAINEASASGNGKVLIPAGRFVTGVLYVKSNVELHLELGASLLATTKRADYGDSDASALLVAKNEHNISITGLGEIDGRGEELLKNIYMMLNTGTLMDTEWKTENPWHQVRPEERNRPKLIEFDSCKRVMIKGVSIKNGLCWVQRYDKCSELLVDSIKVESNVFWNNDGIDIVDCKNVKVTNSFFNADDDGICLKSEDRNSCCENIYVADCTVRSSASAVKLGTASLGGFKNVIIENVRVYDTFRSAIAIECVDGGVLENVQVNNIQATNTGNAICIRLGHRNKDSAASVLRNVYIGNMYVEVPKEKPDKGYSMEGPLLKYPHNVFPSSITGIPGHPVQNVTLENITIAYQGGADRKVACFGLDSLDNVPERIDSYPEFSMFGELPAWGFYVRYVEGLQLKNIHVSYEQGDFRPAFVFDDVAGLELNKVIVPTAKEMPVLLLHNVNNKSLKQVELPVDNAKGIVEK